MAKFWIANVILAAAVCAAQTTPSAPAQPQNPAPSLNAPGQSQQPAPQAQQQPPAQGAQPAAPQGPSASGKKVQAKSKPEFDAFQAADKTVTSDPDLAKGEAAAGDFQTKFPDSDLTSILYDKLMKRYQQANSPEKSVEMGRKELMLDPQSLPALLTVVSIVSQTSHETDPDFSQRSNEVTQDANKAIQLIDNPQTAPAGLAPEQLNSLKSLAYGAIGNIEFVQAGAQNETPAERAQHDAAAEQALTKSTQLNTLNPDPGEWLRLAVTLDHEKKYPEALAAANNAVKYAATEPNIMSLAQQEQTRLKELAGSAPPAPAPVPH
jgi:hypothetical protein